MAASGSAIFGAKHIVFGGFSEEEVDTAAPKYEAPQRIGPLMTASMTITNREGSAYGDDVTQVHISRFGSATIAVDMTDADKKVIGYILGAEVTEDGTHIKFKASDKAKTGGLAYIKNIARGDTEVFEAKFYTKVTGARTADNAETQGEGITFTSYPMTFTAVPPLHTATPWLEEQEFDTLQEAKDWIHQRFTGTGE